MNWPNKSLLDKLGIEIPIIQAPMAGACGSAMAIATCEAGALGSLPFAMLEPEQMRRDIEVVRQRTDKPFNVNFFCHKPSSEDANQRATREATWKKSLTPYYSELGLEVPAESQAASRSPFNDAMCQLVEQQNPAVVSFHFGLPEASLVKRVKDTGAFILSSATSAEEAQWLEQQGCDAIIAQGYEAGGHRGSFLSNELSTQAGTLALVPQVVDAVSLPVIAAGGIADGRGIAAAMALGASAVQIGTAYLFTAESLISELHRNALFNTTDNQTAVTNVFSGKPARGVMNRIMRESGPLSDLAPAFPTAGNALAPLKKAAEASGSSDFSSLWSGQSARLARRRETDYSATKLTRDLAQSAQGVMQSLSGK